MLHSTKCMPVIAGCTCTRNNRNADGSWGWRVERGLPDELCLSLFPHLNRIRHLARAPSHAYAPPTRMLFTGMWTIEHTPRQSFAHVEVHACVSQDIRTQFYDVADDAHDEETHSDGLADAEEFAAIGWISGCISM